MTCALILAAGRSRRFGSEKAMAMADGRPLLAHAVDRLAAQGFEIAVNAPFGSGAAHWAAEHGYRLIPDDSADPAGPLAGVMAGLLWAQAQGDERLATTPCDTPDLPADLETRLASALTPDAGAATARSPSGLQSLCTVWRVAKALPSLRDHFVRGDHPAVHDLLAELAGVEVVFDSDAPFANLNSPDDLRAWTS